MIFDDETNALTRKPTPRNLEKMSITDLKEYMILLKEESQRAEQEIAKKEKLKSAADALFGGNS